MIHAYKKWPVLLLLFLSNICFAKQSDYAPIKGLVSRIAPSWVHQIIFQTIPSDKDIFELNWKNGKLVVEGNNINSMAVGFNYYLKYYCHTDVTWYSADKIELPEKMPRLNGTVRQKSNYTDRFFLNYCTYG